LDDAKREAEEAYGIVHEKGGEVVMYIVARKDLKMSAGKLAAQVGHGVQDALEICQGSPVDNLVDLHWFMSWVTGSRTKIVLAAGSLAEIETLHSTIGEDYCRLVEDEGRTEIAPTKTVLALVPMPKSRARPFVGHLPLYR